LSSSAQKDKPKVSGNNSEESLKHHSKTKTPRGYSKTLKGDEGPTDQRENNPERLKGGQKFPRLLRKKLISGHLFAPGGKEYRKEEDVKVGWSLGVSGGASAVKNARENEDGTFFH